jgi:hypothetical protein
VPQIVSPATQFNKIITHPNFFKSLLELKNKKINLNFFSNSVSPFDYGEYPSYNGRVIILDDNLVQKLNPSYGAKLVEDSFFIAAYDESIEKYDAIEGSAYLTSHSMIYLSKLEYLPIVKINFNFYTRSIDICKGTEYITHSENIEVSRSQDYVKIRDEFIKENAEFFPDNTIFFIDGPLLGGNISASTTKLNEYLLNRGIIPIFIVIGVTRLKIKDKLTNLHKLCKIVDYLTKTGLTIKRVIASITRLCLDSYQDIPDWILQISKVMNAWIERKIWPI